VGAQTAESEYRIIRKKAVIPAAYRVFVSVSSIRHECGPRLGEIETHKQKSEEKYTERAFVAG
jgi:hypothetical protein